MGVEFRAFPFELRGELDDTGSFEGYASVFGNLDSYGTIVDKGAFKQTIKHANGKFPLLWFHDPMTPVGMVEAEEDDHGLLVKGAIDLDIEPGVRMYSGLKKGYIDRMSIGFNRITEEVVKKVTHLKELALWESSLITRFFAANDLALVSDIRAAVSGIQRLGKPYQEALNELRIAMHLPDEGEEPSFDEETIALLRQTRTLLSTSVGREGIRNGDSEAIDHSLLQDLRQIGANLRR